MQGDIRLLTMSKKIFLIHPLSPDYDGVFKLVLQAALNAGVELVRIDTLLGNASGTVAETLLDGIEHSDAVIFDVSQPGPNTMYELGYAGAFSRPIILIANTFDPLVPPLPGMRVLRYPPIRSSDDSCLSTI